MHKESVAIVRLAVLLLFVFTGTLILRCMLIADSEGHMTNLEKKNDEFFTVLDVLEVVLPSEISWSASDIQNELHRGAIFRTSVPTGDNNSSDGYVLFCDVSNDAEEPEIEQLTKEGLPNVESSLREALSKQFNILSTGETKLLKNDLGQNVLISTYIVDDGGTELALVSLRTSISGAKWISVCACSPEATSREPLLQVAANAFRL